MGGVRVASTTASAGSATSATSLNRRAKAEIEGSIQRLSRWLEENDYRGYDTFDGLSAVYLRPLTFSSPLLRTVLQQGVRRFPLNLRPILGIRRHRSSKGMGFLARGFIRLHKATGDPIWASKAKDALQWLIEHPASGYKGMSWGNHFDYQSRAFFLPKGVPTVVWTSLIGHAFLDAYEHFQDTSYLNVAVSSCEHILTELTAFPDGEGVCIAYVPGKDSRVHNANTLGASLLIRTYAHAKNEDYRDLAEKALQYTAGHQQADGAWYYGEKENLHWVDNFHTAYVLDCFLHYQQSTGDMRFNKTLLNGYRYWKEMFFLPDGTPRYYNHKTLPLDIQCSSQAIDTLVFFRQIDPDASGLALKVARWTIANMQDDSGYFYYRRYSSWMVNKTPTLHWGQATMLSALAGLYSLL
jgi:polysaccharide biosynthesis protein VpsJ